MRIPVVLLALTFLAVAVTPASAATSRAGTVAGKLTHLPGTAKGAKRTLVVRAVDMRNGTTAATSRLRRPSFRLKLAPGPYLLVARSFDLPGRGVFEASRPLLVRRGRLTRRSLEMRRAKRGRAKPSARASASRRARSAAARQPYIFGVDPKLMVTGADGYPNGLPLDNFVAALMFERECQDVTPFKIVELERRVEIIRELELADSPYFDKSRAVRARLVNPRQMVRGSGRFAGGRFSMAVRIVDLDSFEQLATARVEGPEEQFFELMNALVADLMNDLCTVKVDVTFTGSGTYDRTEGSGETSSQHHVHASFDWTTVYRGVKLSASGATTMASSSQVSGQWSDDGRFGDSGPGSFRCSGPVLDHNGEFSLAKVERTADGFRVTAWPFFLTQPDTAATACSGLSSAPYATFALSGTEPSVQATVDVDPAGLGAGPLGMTVGPGQSFPESCSGFIGDHAEPCRQAFSWSGQVQVTRAE